MSTLRAKKSMDCQMHRNSIAVLALCGGIIVPGIACSIQVAGNTAAVPGVTLSAEYDDNVYLASGVGKDQTKDDLLLHVIPVLALENTYNEHEIDFKLYGDYRNGTSTGISDLNMNVSGGVNLNFAGGLQVGLSDAYETASFDQQLYGELGVTDSQSNTYALSSSYAWELLKAEGGYEHTWEEYEEEHADVDRNIDKVTGTLTAVASDSWQTYLSALFQTQDSAERANRNYDDARSVVGAKWSGPNRFAVYAEGGYEEIDYESAAEEDLAEFVGTTGMEIQFTEKSKAEASLGRDGYGNLTYRGILNHTYDEDSSIQLLVMQNSTTPFSSYYSSATAYETTLFQLSGTTTLLERLIVRLEASYQLQNTSDDVKIWIGKATMDYPVQDWLKIGTHYQYSARTASRAENEYDDNRIGFFVTFAL